MIGNSFSNSSSDISVALFIQKTYEILQNEANSHTIHWLTSGREFVIVNIKLFEDQILPTYFRHRNIHSFIRQLNMYGFHKSRKDPSKNIFSNPSFMRGRTDLLPLVRRKARNEDKQLQNETSTPSPKSSKPLARQTLAQMVESQQKTEQIIFSTRKQERKQQKKQQRKQQKRQQRKYQKKSQKDDNYSPNIKPKIPKIAKPKKVVFVTSHVDLPESEANLSNFECKNMINPSKVMVQNPAIYSNLNANQEQEQIMCDQDDNLSIEDEIEKQRKVVMNCFSGVSLLETNHLKSHILLHNL